MKITLVHPEKLPNDHAPLAPKKTRGNFGLELAQNDLLVLLVCSVRIRTRSDVRPRPLCANPLTFFFSNSNTSCSWWSQLIILHLLVQQRYHSSAVMSLHSSRFDAATAAELTPLCLVLLMVSVCWAASEHLAFRLVLAIKSSPPRCWAVAKRRRGEQDELDGEVKVIWGEWRCPNSSLSATTLGPLHAISCVASLAMETKCWGSLSGKECSCLFIRKVNLVID